MLRSFIDWLDSYLAGEGPAAVVKAAIGLLSFSALLGTIFGSAAIRLGAMGAALLVFLSIALILMGERRRQRRELAEYERVVMRYSDAILDERKPVMRLKSLEHVAVIDRNGDVRETIRLRVVALKKELYFIPHIAGPAWAQPLSQLRKVKVEVRGLSVDGRAGTKWFRTCTLRDGKLHLLAHLNEPVPLGTEVSLEIVREWPGKCTPLMRWHERDVFSYDFTRQIDHLKYVVIFPRGIEVYCDPIGFAEGASGFKLEATRNQQECTEVTLVATDVPVDRHVGMCLEVK